MQTSSSTRPPPSMSPAQSPRTLANFTVRETFERAAIVARDYSHLARRIIGGRPEQLAELADLIVKNEVSLDGGCDGVLTKDDSLVKFLRDMRELRIDGPRFARVMPDAPDEWEIDLPETVTLDVTAIIDDEHHIDQFDRETLTQEVYARGLGTRTAEIVCRPKELEEVEGRWLLTLSVEGEVQS